MQCPVCLDTVACEREELSDERYIYNCDRCNKFIMDQNVTDSFQFHFDDLVSLHFGIDFPDDNELNEFRSKLSGGIRKHLEIKGKPVEIVLTGEQADNENMKSIKYVFEKLK